MALTLNLPVQHRTYIPPSLSSREAKLFTAHVPKLIASAGAKPVLGGIPKGAEGSRNEKIKTESKHLRGTLKEDLNGPKPAFSAKNAELLKFHGIYQEKARDKPSSSPANPTIFMIRARIPGGRLSPEQWKVMDRIGSQYGHGSVRLTTRQTVQFHYIAKDDLPAIHALIDGAFAGGSTGACGDVVRNVTQVLNPLRDPKLEAITPWAQTFSDHYKVKSNGYSEIWLNGKQQNPDTEVETIYGEVYLPRKFKIGITTAGDNGIDLFTNDLGLAATFDSSNNIEGFYVYAGGGHGRSHAQPETWAGHAQYLGWVSSTDMMKVSEAIVTTQRDYGDRTNRKHARLKYTIEDMGLDDFRTEAEKRSGVKFDHRPAPTEWKAPNYLGWNKQHDGKWSLGIHMLAGRIVDTPGQQLKTAVARVSDSFQTPVQLTGDQDVVLMDIEEKDKQAVVDMFQKYHVDVTTPPGRVFNRAIACVALPTCNLAITDSERYLPALLNIYHGVLKKHGLHNEAPVVRITGCPNGCGRPYTAEIAFVGQMPGTTNETGFYQVFVGGCPNGTRLNQLLVEKFPAAQFPQLLDELTVAWKNNRTPGESFGDFTYRIERSKLNDLLPSISKEMRLDKISPHCGVTPE